MFRTADFRFRLGYLLLAFCTTTRQLQQSLPPPSLRAYSVRLRFNYSLLAYCATPCRTQQLSIDQRLPTLTSFRCHG
jgi:hypothetical protein